MTWESVIAGNVFQEILEHIAFQIDVDLHWPVETKCIFRIHLFVFCYGSFRSTFATFI